MMKMIREHVVFTGRVQGVGFRYKTVRLAHHYGVTGWIKNCSDGSVEAEFQGREESLDLVIQGLNQDSYIRIEWITRNPLEPDMEERGFSVRY